MEVRSVKVLDHLIDIVVKERCRAGQYTMRGKQHAAAADTVIGVALVLDHAAVIRVELLHERRIKEARQYRVASFSKFLHVLGGRRRVGAAIARANACSAHPNRSTEIVNKAYIVAVQLTAPPKIARQALWRAVHEFVPAGSGVIEAV